MTGPVGESDIAPAFSLPSAKGAIASAALKGKPYVLYFYPKDDTSGCTRQAVDFSEARAAFDALGVRIIGISADSVASHEKFAGKHSLSVTLASDEDRKTIADYGVWVEKSMYGRKYMGIERATFLIGADGRVVRVWRKVKVPGHAAEVLKAAEQLSK